MDIYVDGANSTPNNDTKSKRAKLRKKKGLVFGGSGFAIVTDDSVVMKGFNCSTSSTLMETVALAAAIRMAKPGDTVYTDQMDLVNRLSEYGDINTMSRSAAKNRKKRRNSVNVALYIARAQVNRALKQAGGVNIEYYSSSEAKKQDMGRPGRLVDRMAGVAAGVQALTKNVAAAIGDREVIVR
ncbi:hypothetical protein VPHD397_0161 [Vibrio phage D397]